jgi:hypothetical protein
MIDELKSVLSSAKPLQPRTPVIPANRRPAAQERRLISLSEVPKGVGGPASKDETLKIPDSSSARGSSKLVELNKEFLAEFRKLRQTDS